MTSPEVSKESIIQRKKGGQNSSGINHFLQEWDLKESWLGYTETTGRKHGPELSGLIEGKGGEAGGVSQWCSGLGQQLSEDPPLPACPSLPSLGMHCEVVWRSYLEFLRNYAISIYCRPHLAFLT